MRLCAPTKKPIGLPSVRPNAGLTAAYRRELDKLIDEMQKSLEYWLSAAYKANTPRLAMDAAFNESDHPRDDDGKFGSGGGGSLSQEEHGALKEYQSGMYGSKLGGYANLQAYMRTGKPTFPGFNEEEGKKVIAHLHSAFQKSKLSAPATVYRGVRVPQENKALLNMKPGDTFSDKGVMSTTSDRTVASNRFAYRLNRGDTPLLIEVRLPVGAKAIKAKEIGLDNHEKEVAVAPDTKFRVVSNKVIGGKAKMVIEAVEDAPVAKDSLDFGAYDEGPHLAMDASPAATLQTIMNRLSQRWRRRFSQAAPELADYFAKSMARRSDSQLAAILEKAGFSVKFNMTREMNDVMQATISEQVGLIKSIAERHLTQVQGLVMRSVSEGRDLGTLTTELRARYGVTKRRASLIALDQNNKATATMTRVRQENLGLHQARWRHSHAGREPRPTHVKNDGKIYDVRKGWYDPAVGKYIWPGTEIRCRCTSETIIPGFEP